MMSWGVDLVAGALIIWIDFPMPFKTHQVKSPRSGIPLFFRRRVRQRVQEVEKVRLKGRGCIFSRSPIVQAVAFRPVFEGTEPGAVRLR
jgi:hypothetical protein